MSCPRAKGPVVRPGQRHWRDYHNTAPVDVSVLSDDGSAATDFNGDQYRAEWVFEDVGDIDAAVRKPPKSEPQDRDDEIIPVKRSLSSIL